MTILTLDEVKLWLAIAPASTDQDHLLVPIKASAEEAIEDFCETKFQSIDETNEVHDGVRSDSLLPNHDPIISVEEIRFGVVSDGTGGSVVEPTDYYTEDGEIIFTRRIMPKGRGLVAIDYHWGTLPIPEVVKQALRLTCEAWLRRYNEKAIGSSAPASKSKNRESVSYRGATVGSKTAWDEKTGLPNEVTALLSKYRNMEFSAGNTATRNR